MLERADAFFGPQQFSPKFGLKRQNLFNILTTCCANAFKSCNYYSETKKMNN